MTPFPMLILETFYFMLPAYVANMAPVLAKGVMPGLAKPIDMGAKLRGRPLFGTHKTWRGLLFGVISGIAISFLQSRLNLGLLIPSRQEDWLIIGFLLSFGALFGDMIESMIKRQLNIKEGKPFIPFDQIDFVLGALAFYSLYRLPSLGFAIVALALSFVLHISTNHVGYFLHIREERW